MLSAQPTEMQLAAKRGEILATNQESYSMYGIQLTAEDAAMILQTGKRAMDSENLIEFGSSITPRIIHWFLPAGYFGTNYAGQVAALTEAFYHIKGSLQALYDEACKGDRFS